MKKIISVLAAASLLLALASCGNTQNKQAAEKATEAIARSASSAEPQVTVAVDVKELDNTDISAIEGDALEAVESESTESKPEADIDFFHIAIGDAKVVDTDEGKAIIVEFEFSNNTTHPHSYDSIMNETVSQNGADLNGITILKAIDGYNPLSATEPVEPGNVGTAQKVYALNNETDEVTVTVFRYSEPEKGQVTKTFKLK